MENIVSFLDLNAHQKTPNVIHGYGTLKAPKSGSEALEPYKSKDSVKVNGGAAWEKDWHNRILLSEETGAASSLGQERRSQQRSTQRNPACQGLQERGVLSDSS
jgi:hypothetical protein